MPRTQSNLKLLVPGLFGPIPQLEVGETDLSVPVLERLLRRADRRSVAGRDFVTTLYALFGYPANDQVDLPEGAVNYLAEGGTPGDCCYMRADPVHLRPDRDRLLLFDCEQLTITPAEAEVIAAEFNQHFTQEHMQLLTPHPDRWYLQLEQCPQLRTHSLSNVVGHHIESFMPSGPDARHWRRLNNEMQMLLFQSPVNQQREAAGRLTINGIWLSGVGTLPEISPGIDFMIFADEPAACGLARLAGLSIAPPAIPPAHAWAAGKQVLILWTELLAPVLHADLYHWAEALQKLEQRMTGLVDGLAQYRPSCLELYPCNGECYRLTAANLWRFWRRPRKMSHYLV